MPTVTLYRLRPRGPMRCGAPGVGLEEALPFPTSETVFGAWCWALRDWRGTTALETLLAAFVAREPPFLLAAPLPWLDRVLLLPRPSLPIATDEDAGDAVRDKRGKRFRWVEEGLWWALLRGEPTGAAFADDGAFHQEQAIWAAGAASEALRALGMRNGTVTGPDASPSYWRVAVRPHVAVDRLTLAGALYHQAATWFAPGTDLALPVIWRDEAQRETLEGALALLGETGLGGARSMGYGQFDLAGTETREWPDLGAASAFATLSAYHPTEEEALSGVCDRPAAYDLAMSQGWVERGSRTYAVRLIATGSVLRRLPGRALYGEVVPVLTEEQHAHPVYRYGYAFPVPVTPTEGG